MHSSAFRRLALFAFALAATALPFWKVLLFSDRALLYRDICRDFLVHKTLWARSVAAGHGIPYWNHYSVGGMPFYAHNVEGPLNPLNLIFLLFPESGYPNAMSVFIWSHYVILFGGAYFLARTLGLGRLPSLLPALGLALSGHSLSVHNLVHLLSSLVSVPYFFAFWTRWLCARRRLDLFGASFALAWPIYGGDPQFTYFLALAALAMLILGMTRARVLRAIRDYATLGLLSLLASAAQLLSTLHLVITSNRGLGRLQLDEILSFSFHPHRLWETLFPQFFGNRHGLAGFWGESYVNFPGGTPFVFSTYPGALALVLLFVSLTSFPAALRARELGRLALTAAAIFGFLLAFGVYGAIPLYEWFARYFPLFSAFRYPERMLFWPMFCLWLLALIELRSLLSLQETRAPSAAPLPRKLWPPAIFVALAGFAWIALRFGRVGEFPAYSAHSMAISGGFAAAYTASLALFLRGQLKARALTTLLVLMSIAELAFVGNGLVWDQSKFIADGRRYRLVQEIQADLDNRKEELAKGASRRLVTIEFNPLTVLANRIDHTSLTTFSAFDSLLPNVSTYFGIEDVNGYHALVPGDKPLLWQRLKRGSDDEPDYDLLYDVMGGYYIPRRGDHQQLILRRNESALPYVFIPASVRFVNDREESFMALTSRNFPLATEATIVLPEGERAGAIRREQPAARGVFPFRIRDGRVFEFGFTPASSAEAGAKRFLIWNESFDPHWRAYVNGAPVAIRLANAWAMAIELPALESGREALVAFRYENPLIGWGQVLTVSWFLLALGTALCDLRKRRKTQGFSSAFS